MLEVSPILNTLAAFRHTTRFVAKDGGKGGVNNMTGKSADELVIKVPPGTDTRRLADRYRPLLRTERSNLRTVEEDQRDLKGSLEQLGRYLSLVALVALLLGGLGVALGAFRWVVNRRDEGARHEGGGEEDRP